MARRRAIRKGKLTPDNKLPEDAGLSWPDEAVFLAYDCIDLSGWKRFPFDGGLFDQPADLMSDVFYLMALDSYQASLEPESSDDGTN